MRIEPTNALPEGQQPNRPETVTSSTKKNSGWEVIQGGQSEQTGSVDKATLSTTAEKVESLKAELQNVPEVRRDRILALQKVIQQGGHPATNQQIASAIFADLLGPSLTQK